MQHPITNAILACAASCFLIFTPPGYAAQNDAQLLAATEKAFAEESLIFGDMASESIVTIRAANESKKDSEFHRYQLISYLTHEVEKSAFSNEVAARKKIDLIVQLTAAWKEELRHWYPFALRDQGTALLIRWILDKDASDAQRAAQSFEETIALGADTKDKGGAFYLYAAQYELLAQLAAQKGYSRQAQIDLLKKGIAISKQGQSTYPDYDFSTGLNALYGKFEFVSGGSATGEVIDEWMQYASQRPRDKGHASGASIADALFELKRDAEARVWVEKYIAWQASTVKAAEKKFQAMYVNQACGFGFFTSGFLSYGERNPAGLRDLNTQHCKALQAAASAP